MSPRPSPRRPETPIPTNVLDLRGHVFGGLTVESYVGPSGNKQGPQWRCRCTCGNYFVATKRALVSKTRRSCGCRSSSTLAAPPVDGVPRKAHPAYNSWVGMRQRCRDPAHQKYAYYGGRGIKVDPRWDSFEQFVKDMGPRPSSRHSVDRIDNNGDYTKENCRWALPALQASNRPPIYSHALINGLHVPFADVPAALGVDTALVQRLLHMRMQDVVDLLTEYELVPRPRQRRRGAR